MLTIQSSGVSLLLTLLIPIAVAIITKVHLAPKYKAVLTMILSALVVLIHRSQIDNGSAIITTAVAYDVVVTTAVAIASYLGFWQQLNINQVAAPNVGIGPSDPTPASSSV